LSVTATVSLPDSIQRLALINPTKFLGNLLIAGGLIQQLCEWCKARDIALLVVLDQRYRGLIGPALSGAELVYYPREVLEQSPGWQALRAYIGCLRQIRAFRADVAFFIEEDSVSHKLTHFSGASFRISTSTARYHFGFHAVVPVERGRQGQSERHIWYSYRDAMAVVGLQVPDEPSYIRLPELAMSETLVSRLEGRGVRLDAALAIIHAGATKPYKRWPQSYFTDTAAKLGELGYQVLLIGSGAVDAEINVQIAKTCAVVDLSNALDLVELASLMRQASVVIANDSGPAHLASALMVPGVVVFGPTDIETWRPLSSCTRVLEKKSACDPDCTRAQCLRDRACMKAVLPEHVLDIIR